MSAKWQLVFGQGLEQALFHAARNVDGIDHHDIPVAGLGLVDNGKAGAGAFKLLDVDLDAVGILERLEQGGIRVVAPDQGIEIRRRPQAKSRRCRQARRPRLLRFGNGLSELHMLISPGNVCCLRKN